jgi:hypothetical protein
LYWKEKRFSTHLKAVASTDLCTIEPPSILTIKATLLVRFNCPPHGIQDLGKVLYLSVESRDTELFCDLFRRAEFLRQFQKVAVEDLDRLWFKNHDGKACRYYREGDLSPMADLAPNLPWYVQNSNVNCAVDSSDKVHPEECLFCVLDRKCLQLEADMVRLYQYQAWWRYNSHTYPGESDFLRRLARSQNRLHQCGDNS